MNPTDLKQRLSPAELAATLDTFGPQLSEWIKVLREVDDVLRVSQESQRLTEETRDRHDQIVAQIAQAQRALADVQAEKLHLQADRDATQKRWAAEHDEAVHAFVAEREQVQLEIDRLRKRRSQGEQALGALRAVLATVRSRLDSMSD